jgi:TPR repeat protein
MSSSSSISSTPPVNLICSVCGEKSALRCSNCLGAFYCSVPCQKKDWKVHKVICKKAQELKKGYEALGCHTVEEIDAKLEGDRRLAELGDAKAQYNMGLSYFNGLGVGVDKVESIKWYRLAAEQGYAQAQFNLGNAHFNGDGVSVDKVEAIKWYRLAANQGIAQAQFNLGYAYFNGEGVSVDRVEAIKWYRLAAEQGHAEAQYNLGVAYYHGKGVSVDKVEAIKVVQTSC